MEQNQSLFSLSIEPITKSHLLQAARWAKFLAIAGMVFLGIALLAYAYLIFVMDRFTMAASGDEVTELNSGLRIGYIIFALAMIAVGFFPLLFLLQFANRIKTALQANQQEDLNAAFQSLKKHFRFIGIVLIIVMAAYGLTFVLAILAIGGSSGI